MTFPSNGGLLGAIYPESGNQGALRFADVSPFYIGGATFAPYSAIWSPLTGDLIFSSPSTNNVFKVTDNGATGGGGWECLLTFIYIFFKKTTLMHARLRRSQLRS